jgi:hypothetical protein
MFSLAWSGASTDEKRSFAEAEATGEVAPKADISYRAAAAHPVRILLRRDNPWTENN